MKKFLKSALACAMVVPCVAGLVGCDEKVDKTEVAYNAVFSEVNNISARFAEIENQQKEAQLNINVTINAQQVINYVPIESVQAKLRAVIGASNGDIKQAFANIGIVGESDEFLSLASLYAQDKIGDEAYTLVTPTADTWDMYKGFVYTSEDEIIYTYDKTQTFDNTKTYYMKTQDYMHIYMSSNMSMIEYFPVTSVTAPKDWATTYTQYYIKSDGGYVQVSGETAPAYEAGKYYMSTGLDITEILPMLSDGKTYATLDIGDIVPVIPELPDEDTTNDTLGSELEQVLNGMKNMDYATFKQSVADSQMALSDVKYDNGDIGLKISTVGLSFQLISKASGGLKLVMDTSQVYNGEGMVISMVIDIDLVDEIDTKYIPTSNELEDYGSTPVDFEELMAEWEQMLPAIE